MSPDQDAAGSMTYDGEYQYSYDAWNRLIKVERAYGNTPTAGSEVATIEYGGLGRRIIKEVKNSGDWDKTYEYYYNGQSMIETR